MVFKNFPGNVRDSYRVLLPKFNALRVVIDEQRRNTRDILEQREITGTGSRPKTSAGIQLLLRSIMSEVESLKENNQTWLESGMATNKQDVTQVGAILADLERKLSDVLQDIVDLRKMWETFKRKGSAHTQKRLKSSKRRDDTETLRSCSSRGSRASSEELQLPLIKDKTSKDVGKDEDDYSSGSKASHCDSSVGNSSQECQIRSNGNERILKRRESTYMQRSNRTRQKLLELQTKGMTPEQLRNYYRERSFLNSVARRGSLHADADKRLLEKRGSSNLDSKSTFCPSSSEANEPMKQYRRQYYGNKMNVPSWTREGIMGYRRETTLSFIHRGKPQPVFKRGDKPGFSKLQSVGTKGYSLQKERHIKEQQESD